MKGDFARVDFDPGKHYTGVLHQQGRVWLESDWNEDVQERLDLLWQETRDIIGGCGVPDPGTAFGIAANPDPNGDPQDFTIAGGPGAQGHYYVDGILCRLDAPASYLHQPDYPDPPTVLIPATGNELYAAVYLEIWQRLITYLEDDSLREIALNGPDTATRLKTVAQVKVRTAAENQPLTCATANLPGPGQGTMTTLQPKDTPPTDPCRIPDPATYTGRENHLYRVEIHDGGDVVGAGAGAAFTVPLGQDAAAHAVTLTLQNALTAAQQDALLRAGVVTLLDDDGQSDTARVASVSGATLTLAQGLSGNFTTAKHAALTGGVARFKWSRDNAAFAVRVTTVSADRQTLTLASLGHDQATALRQGDLVEVSDDASDLGPARGHLTYLTADPDPDQFTASLADALPGNFRTDRHLGLRRWDGLGWTNATFDPAATPAMNLGDGVQIQFGGSDLRPGDYWQFAARSADGSVEALNAASPKGIIRHVCPLAIVRWSYQTEYDFKTIQVVIQILAQDQTFSSDQVDILNQQVAQAQSSGRTSLEAIDLVRMAQAIGATPAQIAALTALLEHEQGTSRLVLDVIEDCRQPFEPLTKPCCDCTVTVAPGESLSVAIDKIGPVGGVVCLLPGLHELAQPVTVTAKRRLTIRGAGAATVIAAPTAPSALIFNHCDDVVLHDLTLHCGETVTLVGSVPLTPVARVAAGAILPPRAIIHAAVGPPGAVPPPGIVGPPPGTVVPPPGVVVPPPVIFPPPVNGPPPAPPPPPDPLGNPELFNGVITFEDCRAVRVTNCTVICDLLGGAPGERTCITFRVSPELVPSTTTTVTVTTTQPGPESGKAVDFTLRDSRLYAAVGQSGLLVADSYGATIEDNWLLPMALLNQFGLAVQPQIPVAERADFGVVLAESNAVTLANNEIVGFNVAALARGENLTLRGNRSTACGAGAVFPFPEGVVLSENAIAADGGPALYITGSGGETIVHGNHFIGVPITGPLPGAAGSVNPPEGGFAAVADLSGQTAIVTGNNFAASGTTPPTFAVRVQANYITYSANRSQCSALPTQTNVMLTSFNLDSGAVTAVGNTCVEPRGAGTGAGGSGISLQVRAATAVTGMNLTSYRLLRSGNGSDTGSVEGVF